MGKLSRGSKDCLAASEVMSSNESYKKNVEKSSRAISSVGAIGALLLPTATLACAVDANATTVNLVTNITSDKSIYTSGVDTATYTITVQNRLTTPTDTTSLLDFESGINGMDFSQWTVTANSSISGEFTPNVAPNSDTINSSGDYGFHATLPKLQPGEKITVTVKAPVSEQMSFSKQVTATVAPSDGADVEQKSDTSTSSVSPQVIQHYGNYGINVTPVADESNSSAPITGNNQVVSYDVNVSNSGDLDNKITWNLFNDFTLHNAKIVCVENCSDAKTINPTNNTSSAISALPPMDLNEQAPYYFTSTVPAGKTAKFKIIGTLSTPCDTSTSLTNFGQIAQATMLESGDNSDNSSSTTVTTQKTSCGTIDLSVSSVTQDATSETNGIKPYIISSNADGSLITNNDQGSTNEVQKEGSISTFNVTYSNNGSTDEWIDNGVAAAYGGISNGLLNTKVELVPVRTGDSFKNSIFYDPTGEGAVSVVSSSSGASVNFSQDVGYAGAKGISSMFIPAGGSVTVKYKFVPIASTTSCQTHSGAKLQESIKNSNYSQEVNKDNNVFDLPVTVDEGNLPSCSSDFYDATTSITGVYSDPGLTQPINGNLAPGEKVYVKSRETLTSDSTVNLKNMTSWLAANNSNFSASVLPSSYSIADSNNSNLNISSTGELSGTWHPGDYVEIATEYTMPQEKCTNDPNSTDMPWYFHSYVQGLNPSKPSTDAISSNDYASTTRVLHTPQCSGTLAITKTADEGTVGLDGTSNYTITLKNTGNSKLTTAQLVDKLPFGATGITVTGIETTGGALAPNKNSFQINKNIDENGASTDLNLAPGEHSVSLEWGTNSSPAMPAGSSVTIHMKVQQDNSYGAYNQATFSAADNDPGLFTSVNADAFESINLGNNLSLNKTVNKPNANPGEKVTYTLDLTNYGNDLSDAYLKDEIDQALKETNPNGYSNVSCRPLTKDDNVLATDATIGTAICPTLTNDSSGLTAHVTDMPSNSGLRITYDAIAPKDPTTAANIASFTNSAASSVKNFNDAISQANILVQSIQVSGTVWHDADNSAGGTFNNIQTNGEVGTNAGNQLSAVLVDSSGLVINSAVVNADGTYSMQAPINTQGLSVALVDSSKVPVVGSQLDSASVLGNPSGWINTTPTDHTQINTTNLDVANIDFGLEQPPTAVNVKVPSQENPGRGIQVQVPNLSGSDPEDGSKGAGSTFRVDSLPTDGMLYYDGSKVTVGQVISNYDPTKFTVDPNGGNVNIDFKYSVVDAAGQWSPSATVTMPFIVSPVSIAGTVFADGNKNGSQDSGESGLAGVKISLSGTDEEGKAVSASTTTDSSGHYSFDNLVPGTYSVSETQPGGYSSGVNTVGTGASTSGSVSGDSFTGVDLADGNSASGYNFAEIVDPVSSPSTTISPATTPTSPTSAPSSSSSSTSPSSSGSSTSTPSSGPSESSNSSSSPTSSGASSTQPSSPVAVSTSPAHVPASSVPVNGPKIQTDFDGEKASSIESLRFNSLELIGLEFGAAAIVGAWIATNFVGFRARRRAHSNM